MFPKPKATYGEDTEEFEGGLRFTSLEETTAAVLRWGEEDWRFEKETRPRGYNSIEPSEDSEGLESLHYDAESGTVTYRFELDLTESDVFLSSLNPASTEIMVEEQYNEAEFQELYDIDPAKGTENLPTEQELIGENSDEITETIYELKEAAELLRRHNVKDKLL